MLLQHKLDLISNAVHQPLYRITLRPFSANIDT